RLNRIRRDNVALHDNRTLRFHRVTRDDVDVDELIAYSKSSAAAPVTPTGRAIYRYEGATPPPPGPDNNVIVTVVNLDPVRTQAGWVELPLAQLGIDAGRPFTMHDLIDDVQYTWNGAWNYVELDPSVVPA